MTEFGIDALSYYVPSLYVDLKDLAEKRGISYEKLKFGLGLEKMAVPDANEDAASFAANALISMFDDHALNPADIGRIYLGTESAVDGSKPTSTYAYEMLEDYLSHDHGPRSLKHCDVVDMTFACIGAVDAMQNCLDWVRAGDNRQAIVVASDVSKYDIGSSGEYTQGAGAVAVLLKKNPRIIEFGQTWGVATKGESDFFKPRRYFDREKILEDLAQKLDGDLTKQNLQELLESSSLEFWKDQSQVLEVFKEEPVFDGQYSNECYSDRLSEAFEHFENQSSGDIFHNSDYLVFHLPYAFHGRRIIFKNWLEWLRKSPDFNTLIEEIGTEGEDNKIWQKAAMKSSLYKNFVNNKIAAGELASSAIGNMYTASIFMSLLSLLQVGADNDQDLSGRLISFVAYGSGSKSKVFQARICSDWRKAISGMQLFKVLGSRQLIDVATYEGLHLRKISTPVGQQRVRLKSIEPTEPTKLGFRSYSFKG